MLLKKKRIKIRKKISITFNRIFYPSDDKFCDRISCMFFERSYSCKILNIAYKYGVSEPYLCEFAKFRSEGREFTYIPDCNAIKEI